MGRLARRGDGGRAPGRHRPAHALARTAHFLVELGLRLQLVGLGSEAGFACPLNQYLLADALGLTAIHVNRILRQLRERKLLTFRDGQVVFHDLAAPAPARRPPRRLPRPADVEGYSRLMALDEATLATLSSHRAAVDDLILILRGRIRHHRRRQRLAEFRERGRHRPCAVSMQQAVAALNAGSEEQRMWFRMRSMSATLSAKDGDIFGWRGTSPLGCRHWATAGGIGVSRGVRVTTATSTPFASRIWASNRQEHRPSGLRIPCDRGSYERSGSGRGTARGTRAVDPEACRWRGSAGRPRHVGDGARRRSGGGVPALPGGTGGRVRSACTRSDRRVPQNQPSPPAIDAGVAVELGFWDSVKGRRVLALPPWPRTSAPTAR